MGIVDIHLCKKIVLEYTQLTYQHSTNLNSRRSVCRLRGSFFCSVRMLSFGRHSSTDCKLQQRDQPWSTCCTDTCTLNSGVTSTSTDLICNSYFESSQITLQGSDPVKVSFTAGAEPYQLEQNHISCLLPKTISLKLLPSSLHRFSNWNTAAGQLWTRFLLRWLAGRLSKDSKPSGINAARHQK